MQEVNVCSVISLKTLEFAVQFQYKPSLLCNIQIYIKKIFMFLPHIAGTFTIAWVTTEFDYFMRYVISSWHGKRKPEDGVVIQANSLGFKKWVCPAQTGFSLIFINPV